MADKTNPYEALEEIMNPIMNGIWRSLAIACAKTDEDKANTRRWFDVFEKHGIDAKTACAIIIDLGNTEVNP